MSTRSEDDEISVSQRTDESSKKDNDCNDVSILLEHIRNHQWSKAKEYLDKTPADRYGYYTDPSNGRTVLHVLCRLCYYMNSNIGKDGIEEDVYSVEEDEDRSNFVLDGNVGNDDEKMEQILEVAQMLIDATHYELPPVALPFPSNQDKERSTNFKFHTSVLTIQDYLGSTPLHCLAGNRGVAPSPLIRLFLNSCIRPIYSSDVQAHANFTVRSETGLELKSDLDPHENKRYRVNPTQWQLLSAQNTTGCVPLHFIAEGNATISLARYLALICYNLPYDISQEKSTSKIPCAHISNTIERRNPLLIQDEDGETPLHFACSGGVSRSFLQLFISHSYDEILPTNKNAVFFATAENKLPIDALITWFADDFDNLMENLNFTTSGNDLFSEVSSDKIEYFELKNALHSELWPRAEVLLYAAAMALYHKQWYYSQEVEVEGLKGIWKKKPLHLAASISFFPALILQLALSINPDAIADVDSNGWMPLHVACSALSSSSIEKLTEGFFYNDSQFQPSHRQNHQQYPRTDVYPELARWQTPLQQQSMIQYLVKKYPPAAQVLSRDGRLPLHLAVLTKNNFDMEILPLLQYAPDGLVTIDPVTRLYPFMLAATYNQSSLDVVYRLLLEDPELVQCGITVRCGLV